MSTKRKINSAFKKPEAVPAAPQSPDDIRRKNITDVFAGAAKLMETKPVAFFMAIAVESDGTMNCFTSDTSNAFQTVGILEHAKTLLGPKAVTEAVAAKMPELKAVK